MLISDFLANPTYRKKSLIERLIMHRCDLSKEELFTRHTDVLSDAEVSWIDHAYQEVTVEHRPLEYVLGYCEFAGHRFGVTEATLIPRPETEYMIEAVREWICNRTRNKELRAKKHVKKNLNSKLGTPSSSLVLLDIGTGCGVLGLSTLLHCGDAIGEAIFTDLSEEALEVGKGNAAKLLGNQKERIASSRTACPAQDAGDSEGNEEGDERSIESSTIDGLPSMNDHHIDLSSTQPTEALVEMTRRGYFSFSEIKFFTCSLLDHPLIREVFDRVLNNSVSIDLSSSSRGRLVTPSEILLIANLPYIPNGLFEDNTDPSVHNREPKMAFVGGDDGMDLYRVMLDEIIEYRAKSLELRAEENNVLHSSCLLAPSSTCLTLFLEMMTWQVEILRKEYGEWFEFEEVKTFHFNIRIVKGWLR